MTTHHERNTLPISCKSWADLYRDLLQYIKPDTITVEFHRPSPRTYNSQNQDVNLVHYKFDLDFVKARIFDELGLFTGSMTQNDVVIYDRSITSLIQNARDKDTGLLTKHRGVVAHLFEIAKFDR